MAIAGNTLGKSKRFNCSDNMLLRINNEKEIVGHCQYCLGGVVNLCRQKRCGRN